MWDNLDLDRKRKWIQFFVRNGITDRQRMKSEYDAMYLKKMEDVAQQNYANWGYDSPEKALVHALNDNTYDYNKWFADNPGSTENSDTHWSDGYKTVYHPTFSDESMYSGVVDRNYNPEGRVGGYWDQDGEFVPASWQDDVEYKKGGSINIKHPGRLTELKKRTGKTEAELYNDGNPAHKKMVVFARNARQWNHKHQLGGNVDNWMSWWYKNRTPQLVSNFDEYYNVGSSGYEPIADRAYEANLLVGDALNDVAGIGVHKAPLAGDLNGYLSENVYGGEPKIVLGYDERPDIELHEKTHYLNHLLGDCYNEDGRSYFNSPFQMAIGDVTTGDLFEDENGRYQHDEYLDNQDEIYSRLNQIRYRNGLDPKKKYTEKEIEDMRRKGMLTLPNGDGLERYTNKFIQHLLNDVAYNNAYDSNTSHYAANGGHLFQGYSDSKLRFVNNQPVIYNDKGVLLPDITIKPENESLFTYDENGVPTASDTLKQEVAYWGTPQGMVEAAFNRADKKTAQQERAENYEKYGPIVGDVMNQGPVSSYLTGITNYVTDHTKRAFTHPWQTFKEDWPTLQYFIPGWGEGVAAHDVKEDVKNGDYLGAAIGAGLLALPAAKNLKNETKDIKALVNPKNWSKQMWTDAQDLALYRGDMAEAQRLRDLHFKVNAPNTKQATPMYNASGESTFNEFNGGETGLNWFSESEKYAANHGVPRAFYINEPDIYFGNVPAWIKGTPADKRYIQSLRKLGYTEKQIAQKVQEINEAANSTAPAAKSVGMGSNNELVTRNNNTIKLADAVTYGDDGVRIPLGERDNFNINDTRYGLIPAVGLGLYGLQQGINDQREYKNGGQIIWDNDGQWSHPGQITGIIGNNNGTPITMNHVKNDLVGIDNYGNAQYMTEGNNYYFPGQYVVEYPVRPHKAQIGTQFITYQQKPSIAPFVDENAYYDDKYKKFNINDWVDQDGTIKQYPDGFGQYNEKIKSQIDGESRRRRNKPLFDRLEIVNINDPCGLDYNYDDNIFMDDNGTYYRAWDLGSKDYYNYTKELTPVSRADYMKALPKRDYIGGKDYRWKAFNMINGLTDTVQNLSQMYGVDPNVMAHRLMKEGFIDDFTNRYNNMSPGEQKRYRDEIWKYGQDGFENFGTDHISSLVDEGKIKFKRNIGYHPYTAINEKGELANTAMFDNLSGALEANAATLGYITNEMKKKGYSGNNLKSAVNAAYNMGLYNDYLTNAIDSGRYNVPTYFQFGGLLDKSKFNNYALQAGLQGMRAGLPMMQLGQEGLAPYITSDANYGYVPYSQNYEVQEKPKQKSTASGKQQKRTKADKMAFVRESFDNWYDTFAGHGHSHDDSVRMAKFFALQDAYESGYGNKMSVENNNFGGMNDVKEARRQGVHFVPVKYNTKKDYYEAKYNDIVRKWSGALLPETVTIEDFYNALHANPAYQYAPKDVNPNYLNSLLGMKSAQKWIDEYSANYGRGFQEGGLAKPFSYKQLPVVRFDKGGHAYIAK